VKSALFVVPIDEAGGAEKILAMVAGALAKSEHWRVRIQVLAQRGSNSYFSSRCVGADIYYGFGGGRLGSELGIVSVIRAQEFDLVYATHARVNAFLSVARRMGVLQCRRLVTRESTVVGNRFSGLKLLAYRLLYKLYGGQDIIVSQTELMTNGLKKSLPVQMHNKIILAHNPVEIPPLEGLTEGDGCAKNRDLWPVQLVWCGRFIPVKRPALALEVLAALRASMDLDIGLVMIGCGPLEAHLREKVEALELTRAVVILGQLENPSLLFADSDYGIVTSRSEGFPNVVLEMLACGVQQVVTTPCAGGLDKISGVVVAQDSSVQNLVSALNKCIANSGAQDPAIVQALLERSPDEFVSMVIGEALQCEKDPDG